MNAPSEEENREAFLAPVPVPVPVRFRPKTSAAPAAFKPSAASAAFKPSEEPSAFKPSEEPSAFKPSEPIEPTNPFEELERQEKLRDPVKRSDPVKPRDPVTPSNPTQGLADTIELPRPAFLALLPHIEPHPHPSKFHHFRFRHQHDRARLEHALRTVDPAMTVEWNEGQGNVDATLTVHGAPAGKMQFLHFDRRDRGDRSKYYAKIYFYQFQSADMFRRVMEAVKASLMNVTRTQTKRPKQQRTKRQQRRRTRRTRTRRPSKI